jgi:hypothetical protein
MFVCEKQVIGLTLAETVWAAASARAALASHMLILTSPRRLRQRNGLGDGIVDK